MVYLSMKKLYPAGIGWPFQVTKCDLEITYYRSSGAGGQHRNKVSTACRIKHIPTGITTTAEDSKSQNQNKKSAFKKLVDILVPIMRKECSTESRAEVPIDRVRTYKESTDLVIDERLPGCKFSYSKFFSKLEIEAINKLLKIK